LLFWRKNKKYFLENRKENMMPAINDKIAGDERPLRVGLSTAYRIVLVSANTIKRCEALNNYTRFYFADNRTIPVCCTPGYLEE
jgi:hypothetical protein